MSPNELKIPVGTVTIRRLGDADRDAAERLAQLDSRRPLEGELLGAEVEGSLIAAISLESGDVIADPFSRTGELRSLLELRSVQLQRRARFGRIGRRVALRSRNRRPATLAGSAPGVAGHLTILPRNF